MRKIEHSSPLKKLQKLCIDKSTLKKSKRLTKSVAEKMRLKLILFSLIYLFMVIFVIADEVEAQSLEGRRVKAQTREASGYEIRLKSRSFTPPGDIGSAIQSHIRLSKHKRVHVLMQFYDIPDIAQRGILNSAGVELLNYIPHKGWFVSVPKGVIQAQLVNANVRWIGPILPEDKIFPPLLRRSVASWAVNNDGSVNLEVSFFKDVSLDRAASLMAGMGAMIKERSEVSNRLTVTISPDRLMDIADEDIVRWIIEERPPKIPLNDGSRANVGADIVQATPYNLSGANVDIGIWDGGDVDSTHDDFGARVTIVDGAGVDDHATHVAGTMGGAGTRSLAEGGTALQWRGMAPNIDIISFLWDNNIPDHNAAINTYGIELSQNSWGYNLLGPPPSPEYYGYYGLDAPEYDDIITGLYGSRISVVFAAGNDRDNVAGDYDTIGPPSTSKNMLCVGAINSDDDTMTTFSGWGPMDDGRIKPDVVAPGDELGGEGYIKSTLPGDTYGGPGWLGTSMAAPVISGCASLIIEDYRNLFLGADPLPSTVKALIMHEARDLGNTGPDYAYGYGGIQIQDSIDKLRTESLVEDEVGHEVTDAYTLTVPGGTTLVKITLVWDDEPATEGALTTLVNDLDLIVRDPNNDRHYPWTLDPANPSNAAVKTQEDHINNVEQVLVDTGIISGEWTIEVYGNNVPIAPQRYSLIFSPNRDSVTGKIYKDTGYSEGETFFDRTDTIYIEAFVFSDGSPLTGAVVTADLKLSDETPVTTVTLTDAGGGYYRNSWDSAGETPDVYSVDINVADPPLNTRRYFHLYPEGGVSAYRLDYDEDGNDDYILENRHLIAVYDGKPDTDRSLLYLEQKDTDVSYSFAEIADGDTIGRAEVTTTNLKGIKFNSFSFSQSGENKASVDLSMTTEVSDPTEELITSYDASAGASQDTRIFVDNDQWLAERFNPADLDIDYTLTKVSVFVDKDQNASNPLIVEIRTDQSGLPSNTVLTSESIPASSIPSTSGWVEATFSNQITLEQSGLYWLILRNIDTRSGNPNNPKYAYTWTGDDTSPTYPGILRFSQDQGTNWPAADVDMFFRTYGIPLAVTAGFDIAIQMKTQEVDYLVYKLSNFDEFIDDINDIFAPISGSLGASVDDDRYRVGDGTDGLISSLTSGIWTDFSALADAQKYIAIYDNSNVSDAVNDNIISWVYFPNANTLNFSGLGAWFETDRDGFRIRYDTTGGTITNEAKYLLVFTQGSYPVIGQWMPTIAGGALPAPNFISPPSALSISVLPTGWSIGQVTEGQISQSGLFTVTNDGSVIETFSLSVEGPSAPSLWTAGLSSAGDEIYLMKGLFGGTADDPTGLFSLDDVIIIGSPSPATANQFGDPAITLNGTSVEIDGQRGLWFEFEAPASTSTGGLEQTITINVGAQES